MMTTSCCPDQYFSFVCSLWKDHATQFLTFRARKDTEVTFEQLCQMILCRSSSLLQVPSCLVDLVDMPNKNGQVRIPLAMTIGKLKPFKHITCRA